MNARIDVENSPLLDEGYCRCLYIELSCEQCGCWRMCIEPESDVACPKCASTGCMPTVLAKGLTRRELPIVELYTAAHEPHEQRLRSHLASSTPYFAEIDRRLREHRNSDH